MTVLSNKKNRQQVETEHVLGQPLLINERIQDSNSEASYNMEGDTTLSPMALRSENSSVASIEEVKVRKTESTTIRLYANNAPRIFLETITARTALIIIVITYAIFILGFGLDLNSIYRSFNSQNYRISALDCKTYNGTADLYSSHTWGCTTGKTWNSSVTHLENVLSVKLHVQQSNVTHILTNANQTFELRYNTFIWACYDIGGCGDKFAADDSYTSNPNIWQQVLFQYDQSITITLPNKDDLANEYYALDLELVSNMFQNQESIPTNGLIKSYYLNIEYLKDPYGLFTAPETPNEYDYLSYVTYTFDVSNRDQEEVADAFTVILMFFTVVLLCFYIYVLSQQKRLLSEQKWLVAYIVLVIMLQNPVYCVIVWFSTAPRPADAYACYVVSYVAQSGLFILWLLFADSVHRKMNSKIVFYTPKVLIGVATLVCGIAILTFQFPGVSIHGDEDRNAVEAIDNWSDDLKKNFVGFTMSYMILTILWAVAWFIQLYLTGRKLRQLPYMNTRYLQLSYRFFLVQATLLALYYILQYTAVFYYLSQGTNDTYDVTSVCNSINTLLRQQTHLFGKILFLTVYALILTFLFLPSNLWENSAIKATLAATYVISEHELQEVVKSRRQAIQKLKKNLLNQVTGVNTLVNAKTDVFCVDIAVNLRDVSLQAYYDPPGLKTESGLEGVMDLASIGYEMINKMYNSDHEVFCFVAREITTKRIVVCFRGTASKKQMENNLKYKKMGVNFNKLHIPTLDVLDGLHIRENEETDFDLESISDDDDHNNRVRTQYDLESGTLNDHDEEDNARPSQYPFDKSQSRTFYDRAANVGEGIKGAAVNVGEGIKGAVTFTNRRINKVVGATTGFVVQTAAKTPVLKAFVAPHVHSGFWEAYTVVRGFIHAVLREELISNPNTVFFTGHSLGGALATFAAADVQLHTIPRVNEYLKHQTKLLMIQRKIWDDPSAEDPGARGTISNSKLIFGGTSTRKSSVKRSTSLTESITANSSSNNKAFRPSTLRRDHTIGGTPMSFPAISPVTGNVYYSTDEHGGAPTTKKPKKQRSFFPTFRGIDSLISMQNPNANNASQSQNQNQNEFKIAFLKKIKVVMYNFGSPRVGNNSFAQLYDKNVPSSFRVVVDGDIVSGLPPSGYTHVGTEILIDGVGSGSVIIDPSFVERWLRTTMKSSVAAHSMTIYQKGLLGLKMSAEYMKSYAKEKDREHIDPLRLAIEAQSNYKMQQQLQLQQQQQAQSQAQAQVDSTHSRHSAAAVQVVSQQVSQQVSVGNAGVPSSSSSLKAAATSSSTSTTVMKATNNTTSTTNASAGIAQSETTVSAAAMTMTATATATTSSSLKQSSSSSTANVHALSRSAHSSRSGTPTMMIHQQQQQQQQQRVSPSTLPASTVSAAVGGVKKSRSASAEEGWGMDAHASSIALTLIDPAPLSEDTTTIPLVTPTITTHRIQEDDLSPQDDAHTSLLPRK